MAHYPPKRILIVEDNTLDMRLLKDILARMARIRDLADRRWTGGDQPSVCEHFPILS
jgi:hypothetical protein